MSLMPSAIFRAQVPLINTPLPSSLPEPGRNRLLELPRGVVPGARLEVRPAPATVPSGIAAIDALTGGLPRGALSEIFGPPSSGRASMILAALAAATRRQEVCALVDAGDSLHPPSAAAAGLDLQRLLWIRCGENLPPRHGDTEAIDDLGIDDCRLKSQKTTSSPRMNADKRGSIHHSSIINPQSSASLCLCGEIRIQSSRNSRLATRNSTDNWQLTTDNCFPNRQSCAWDHRLAQVLKTTDLLLQSGGFGMVVVDLADVPPRFARRIPLASWFRFRRAVENTPTVLLVVEQEPYAKTCASLVLRMQPAGFEKQQSAFSTQHSASETLFHEHPIQVGPAPGPQSISNCQAPAHARILQELPVKAEIVHARFQRKPVRSVTQFHTRTAWSDSIAG